MSQPLRDVGSLPVHAHERPDWDEYRLRVDGLVDAPLALSADDLGAMHQAPFDADFVCLDGWVAPDQHWRGIPLTEVLGLARVRPGARFAQVSSGDFSWPLPIADAGRALLALELDGAPLPGVHGGPVRLVVAGGDCFTSVKWVEHIELRAAPAENTAERVARGRIGSKGPG